MSRTKISDYRDYVKYQITSGRDHVLYQITEIMFISDYIHHFIYHIREIR